MQSVQGGGVFLEGVPIGWYAPITDYVTLTDTSENQSSSRTSAYFDNVDFIANEGYYGGAIASRGSALHLESASLTDNLAIYGGGIYQRASQVSMFDGSISNNEATYAAAVRLFEDSSISGNTSNVFSCSSITASAIISGNVTNSSSSSAVQLNGDDSKVRLTQCSLGGNTGSANDPDLKLEDEGSYSFSSSAQVLAVVTADEYLQLELCSGTTDSNGNGLTGWDDPSCSIILRERLQFSQPQKQSLCPRSILLF